MCVLSYIFLLQDQLLLLGADSGCIYESTILHYQNLKILAPILKNMQINLHLRFGI